MRARPELTPLECLSGASFLGKLLVFPANVRLDWKVIARYKHSSIFGLVVSNKGKKFYNIGTRSSSLRLLFFVADASCVCLRQIFTNQSAFFDNHLGVSLWAARPGATTLSIMTFSITTLSIKGL